MSERNKEDFELFCRALEHFSKRLIGLKEDKEIKTVNGMLKKDLDENSKLALEVGELLKRYNSENVTHDHVEMVKSALKLYKDDLLTSGELLKNKLNVGISLKNVDSEVRSIDNVFRNRDWHEPTLDTNKNYACEP